MPQLHLYQTEVDELELIKVAFKNGCRMLPDSNYETPEPEVLRSVEAFQRCRLTERHFFILHEHFMRLPVHMRPISKDGRTAYYISPSQGGPLLEFMGGGIVEDETTRTRRIRSGFLAYSSGYWDAEITKKEMSPAELAEIYKRLAKVIRDTSTRIKPDKSVYWLGNDAKAKLLGGARLGLHGDWSIPADERAGRVAQV